MQNAPFGAFCNTVDLHEAIIGLENQFAVFLRVAVLHRVYGTQWLSGRVLDSRLRGRGFEPHRRHCVVSLNKIHQS